MNFIGLNGLCAFKTHILKELATYQNYAEIERFFDFIIEIKNSKNIDLDSLVNLLTQLARDIKQDSLAHDILTDTLDYMTGWYSLNSIIANTPRANFIKNLKK